MLQYSYKFMQVGRVDRKAGDLGYDVTVLVGNELVTAKSHRVRPLQRTHRIGRAAAASTL